MADYISRKKAVEAIQYRVCQGHGNKEHICERGSCAYCGIMEIISDISSIKAAEVQPVKHTKNLTTFAFCDEFICENCGIHLVKWIKLDVDDYEEYEYKFCPECGSKVKESDYI